MARVRLSDIDTLVFFSESNTKSRRTSPIPQLECTNSICHRYQPDSVSCKNIGGSGSDVTWKCSADLPSALRFGKIDVSCEGWSRPGDPYVLEGSCGLKYDLVKIPDVLRDDQQYRDRQRYNRKSRSFGSTLFGVILPALVLAYILYRLLRVFLRNNSSSYRRIVPPTRGNGGYISRGGGPSGGSGPGPDVPPPPPYTRTDKSSDMGNGWGPGFWSGLGLGGVGAYLWNNARRRENPPGGNYGSNRAWDWERPGTGWSGMRNNGNGRGRNSGFQTTFSSPNEGFWSSSSSRATASNDRGEGTSNLGTVRSSSGDSFIFDLVVVTLTTCHPLVTVLTRNESSPRNQQLLLLRSSWTHSVEDILSVEKILFTLQRKQFLVSNLEYQSSQNSQSSAINDHRVQPMRDASIIGLDTSPDWIECSSARAWARTDLPLESIPSFGSSARSRCHQSIADDEAEIKRLENSIRPVGLKIQELRHRIGQNKARLAPIRLIPNETLSDIFLNWIDIRDSPTSVPEGCFAPPSSIMKVCRRWADCAISTPPIWTHGQYMVDASEIATHDSTKLFNSYFDRSGSRSIKVRFTVDSGSQTEDIWRGVMEPSLSRMEDLSISGLCRSKDPRPDIAMDDWHHRKLVESLTMCTRLTRLCLVGIGFPDSHGQISIVLPTVRRIKYFICGGNPPIHCPALFTCEIEESTLSHHYTLSLSTESPLLEKLSLHMAYVDFGEEEMPSLPTFRCLKHLEVDFHDEFTMSRCFSDSPNLCRLDICLSDDSFNPTIEVISLWSSSLVCLTLTMTPSMVALHDTYVQYMHEWMAQARRIVEFHLIFLPDEKEDGFYEAYGMNMYIEPLLTTKRNPPCFPHLKHISIGGEVQLEAVLLQLLIERASDAELREQGFLARGRLPGIIQRPCLLTLVDSCTLPDMESVGLIQFLELRRMHASCAAAQDEDQLEDLLD